jgi:prolyl-tRNA synthetase
MIKEYEKFLNDFLCVPVLVGEKTEGERFAGADNTYTAEALMQDGQALQCGTSHYLAQNFSNIFQIKFQNKNNQFELIYQTSAGMSTRLIGAIIMSHSDDKGLVLPFGVAPTQVAILSIFGDKNPQVKTTVASLSQSLASHFRIQIDDSDKGLGYKIAEQEVSGTPFIIAIGPKDVEKDEVTLIRRDQGTKRPIKISEVVKTINQEVDLYQKSLYKIANDRLHSSIVEVDNMEDFMKASKEKKIMLAPWGGDIQDEKQLKEKTGISPRCIQGPTNKAKCFFTGKPAKNMVYFAKAY